MKIYNVIQLYIILFSIINNRYGARAANDDEQNLLNYYRNQPRETSSENSDSYNNIDNNEFICLSSGQIGCDKHSEIDSNLYKILKREVSFNQWRKGKRFSYSDEPDNVLMEEVTKRNFKDWRKGKRGGDFQQWRKSGKRSEYGDHEEFVPLSSPSLPNYYNNNNDTTLLSNYDRILRYILFNQRLQQKASLEQQRKRSFRQWRKIGKRNQFKQWRKTG